MSSWARLGGLGLALFGVIWIVGVYEMTEHRMSGWLCAGFGFVFFGLYMLTPGVIYKASPDVWRERYGGYPGWLGFIFQMKIEILLNTVFAILIWLFAAPLVFKITGWVLLAYTTPCVYYFCFRKA